MDGEEDLVAAINDLRDEVFTTDELNEVSMLFPCSADSQFT